MKMRQILLLLLAFLPLSFLHADDVTADNLTVQQSAMFPGTALFGRVMNGLQGGPTPDWGFSIGVSQELSQVNVPYTVEGHYEDGLVTEDDYGWITGGYWQAQYTWGVVSTQWVPPVYDSEGNLITEGYNEDVFDNIYTGDAWVETTYWGVVGTHTIPGPVWVEPYESTYVDYEYGAPRIELAAKRSDANFVWQVPSETGLPKDILVVWNGGLRVPSNDPNRMMALMGDSLTQSYLQPWDGTVEVHDTSELKMNRLKTVNRIRSGTGTEELLQESTSELKAQSLNLKQEYQQAGTSSMVQTQIAATSATFGGVVQVEGNMAVKGVLRVQPAGDLDMGNFRAGPQP